jgi:hypothetical protein
MFLMMGNCFAFLIFVKHRNGSYMFEVNVLQLYDNVII